MSEQMIHRPYGLVSESTIDRGDKLVEELGKLWDRVVKDKIRQGFTGAVQSYSGAFVPGSFADGGLWLFLDKGGQPKWEYLIHFYGLDEIIEARVETTGHPDSDYDDAVLEAARLVFNNIADELDGVSPSRAPKDKGGSGWAKYSGKYGGTVRPG